METIFTKKRFTVIVYVISLLVISTHYDPLHLRNGSKFNNLKKIIEYAHEMDQDPYELLAIAVTESGLNEKAYSHTKDSGLMQVNCKYWWKKFDYSNIQDCKKDMLFADANILASIQIIKYFRKNFKQCQGNNLYKCYNGGQGWTRSKNIHKINRYQKKIIERKHILKKYYSGLINYTLAVL